MRVLHAQPVGQRQRPARVVEAERHGGIDVGGRSDSDHRHLAAEIGDHRAHALGDKAWRVLDQRHLGTGAGKDRRRRIAHQIVGARRGHDREPLGDVAGQIDRDGTLGIEAALDRGRGAVGADRRHQDRALAVIGAQRLGAGRHHEVHQLLVVGVHQHDARGRDHGRQVVGTGIDLRSLGIVVVPAAAGLAAELARRIEALVVRARRHAPVVEEALVDDLAGREVHVDAGEVHQLEGPHAEATAVAHHRVDLRRRGPPLLVDAQALGADRGTAEIDQEARRVADHHRHAGLALAERHHRLDHPGGGVGRADHFDQFHQRHGIEVVHAADTVAVLERARDRGDADGRGVRGDDRLGRDHGLEFAEQLLLHLEILEHRLDDDVAALQAPERVGHAEIGVRLREVGLAQAALGDQPLQGLENRGLGLGRAARGGVEHDRLHAALGRDLRDAAPHGAGTDDAHRQVGTIDVESHESFLFPV